MRNKKEPKPHDAVGFASRPQRGLTLEDALARWSEPKAYQEMMEYADAAEGSSMRQPYYGRHLEYKRRREALLDGFIDQLKDSMVLASGIAGSATERLIIEPSLWDVLFINNDGVDDVGGEGHSYQAVEYFDRSVIPSNVRHLPSWLAAERRRSSHFQHDPSYEHVSLHGVDYTLSPIRAKVVALLHQAALAGDPWRNGKELLEDAGSVQLKMHDAFKSMNNWEELILSDEHGKYRLRL